MKKEELNNLRKNIYYKLKTGVLDKYDIISLVNFSFNDILSLDIKSIEKQQLLYNIYINPFLLCNDYMYKNGILFITMEDIAPLLIKRYNMEIDELTYRLYEYEINQNEYYYQVNSLKKLYFESSIIGRRIFHYYNDLINSEKNIKQKKIKLTF